MDDINIITSGDSPLDLLFVARFDRAAQVEPLMRPRLFAQLLEKGVSTHTLTVILTHIPKSIVAGALSINERSISRLLRRDRLSRIQTEQLDGLTELWSCLWEFFDYDANSLNSWLTEPLPILDGVSPSELIISQFGRGVIRARLDEMRHGDF